MTSDTPETDSRPDGLLNPDIDTQWFHDKIAEKGMSLTKLSQLLGVDKATMSLRLKGKRHIRAADAADLARVLGQPYREVMKRAGVDMRGIRENVVDQLSVPLVGSINGEGKVSIIDWASRERLFEISGSFPSDSMCLQYRTTQSANEMYNGWLAVIGPRQSPSDSDMLDRYCIVGLENGDIVQRVVRRGYGPGLYNLVAPPADTIHDAEIKWFCPVLAIMPV